MKLTESELKQIIEEELKKELISEGQVKQIIREEFAAKGIVLTEEELNELNDDYRDFVYQKLMDWVF
jgi:hypothetical protein